MQMCECESRYIQSTSHLLKSTLFENRIDHNINTILGALIKNACFGTFSPPPWHAMWRHCYYINLCQTVQCACIWATSPPPPPARLRVYLGSYLEYNWRIPHSHHIKSGTGAKENWMHTNLYFHASFWTALQKYGSFLSLVTPISIMPRPPRIQIGPS